MKKVTETPASTTVDKRNVFLFVPNIIDYVRIALLIVGAIIESTSPIAFLGCYAVAIALDATDGWAARKLNQTSQLGSWLDIVCDNVCRTVLWCLSGSTLAPIFISTEWLTFVCTQPLGKNWKKSAQSRMPQCLQRIFVNGFYNPLGAAAVIGLFGSPIVCYALSRCAHLHICVGFSWWQRVLLMAPFLAARLFAMAAELHCIAFHMIDIASLDS